MPFKCLLQIAKKNMYKNHCKRRLFIKDKLFGAEVNYNNINSIGGKNIVV